MGIAACRRASNSVHPASSSSTCSSVCSSDMPCEHCTAKSSPSNKKRTCSECQNTFCSSCLTKISKPHKRYICHKCQTLSSVPMERTALMNLRIRDLKWFLDSRSISFAGCMEKTELVDLVIQQCSPPAPASPASPCGGRMQQPPPSRFQEGPLLTEDYRMSHPAEPGTPEPQVDMEEAVVTDSSAVVNIDDIKDPVQIEGLSVRQLKLILTRNYVDYHGCCEKKDLQERVRRLWLQRKKTLGDIIVDENLCKLCMAEAIDCVLLECGHMATCTACGKRLSECPICRQFVIRVVHTFKA